MAGIVNVAMELLSVVKPYVNIFSIVSWQTEIWLSLCCGATYRLTVEFDSSTVIARRICSAGTVNVSVVDNGVSVYFRR